jgi:hypothetical protein
VKHGITAKLIYGGMLLLAGVALICAGCTGPVNALTIYIDPSSATVDVAPQ